MFITRKEKLKCMQNDYIKYNALLRFLMIPDNRELMESEIGYEQFDELINELTKETAFMYDAIKKNRWIMI